MRKIIVTGGAGFIGSNLIKYLYTNHHNEFEIISLDNYSTGLIQNEINLKSIRYIDFDLTERYFDGFLDTIFKDVECVIHLAYKARVINSFLDPIGYEKNNTKGTLQVLEYCRRYGIKKVFFASSSSVYGSIKPVELKESDLLFPQSPYAMQKAHGERYMELYTKVYGMDNVIMRFFNVYGPNMSKGGYASLLSKCIEAKYGEIDNLKIYNSGLQSRNFTHVDDICEMIMKLVNSDKLEHRIYNIASPKSYQVKEIFEKFGLPLIYDDEKKLEPFANIPDIGRIRNEFGKHTFKDLDEWITIQLRRIGRRTGV